MVVKGLLDSAGIESDLKSLDAVQDAFPGGRRHDHCSLQQDDETDDIGGCRREDADRAPKLRATGIRARPWIESMASACRRRSLPLQ